MNNEEEILKEFNSKIGNYKKLSIDILELIKKLLDGKNIEIHSIVSRVKEENSLKNKIIKKCHYKKIDEITDIIGFRIICFFEHDIKKIVSIIETEFKIVEKSDKKDNLHINSFGYLSYHVISEINENRIELAEYKDFKGIKFEIQIRTILQHAWAEIEHDIGYKTNNDIPSEVRRDFSMVASLLEIADEKFSKIKNNQITLNNKIAKDPLLILKEFINKDTIIQYINNSEILKIINGKLLNIYKIKTNIELNDSEIEDLVNQILFFDINTIKEFDDYLQEYEDKIYKIIKNRKLNIYENLSKIISFLYFFYILGLEKESILNYMEEFNIGFDDNDRYSFIKELKADLAK